MPVEVCRVGLRVRPLGVEPLVSKKQQLNGVQKFVQTTGQQPYAVQMPVFETQEADLLASLNRVMELAGIVRALPQSLISELSANGAEYVSQGQSRFIGSRPWNRSHHLGSTEGAKYECL